MTAHEAERLSAYLDGELGEAARAEVEAHLAACAECRTRLELLRLVDDAAAADVVSEPDGYFEDFAARVRARIERERGGQLREVPARPRWRLPVWGWAAAAAVLLGVVTPLTLREVRPPGPQPSRDATTAQEERSSRGPAGQVTPEEPPDTGAAGGPLRAPASESEREKERRRHGAGAGGAAEDGSDVAVARQAEAPALAEPAPAPAAVDKGAAASRWKREEPAHERLAGGAGVRRLELGLPEETKARPSAPVPRADVATGPAPPAAAATAPGPAGVAADREAVGQELSFQQSPLAEERRAADRGRPVAAKAARAPASAPPSAGLGGVEGGVPGGGVVGGAVGVDAVSVPPSPARPAAVEFRTLSARRPVTLGEWRLARERWRAFAGAHPEDPLADEAAVQAVAAALEVMNLGGSPADDRVLQETAAAYLGRETAPQKDRVRRLLGAAPRR